MHRNTVYVTIALLSLVVLLPLELLLHYDTPVRQVALMVTCAAAICILVLLRRTMRMWGAELPWSASWFIAIAVWFDAAGNFAHLYAQHAWWDNVAHAVGTGAVTLAVFVLLQALHLRGRLLLSRWMMGLFAVSLATTLSVLYEISEYIGDVFYTTNRVTSVFDTSQDLLWNLCAAVLVTLVALMTRPAAHQNAQH